MKTKKPKPLRVMKVFGALVPVYRLENLLNAEGMYGFYDPEGKYIAVDAALEGDILEHTIIHEMMHAVFDRLHIDQQMERSFVEVVVENLSVALLENFEVEKKN
jgi:Zn-dependent peptidase ImmA (M78 family)